MTKLTKTLLTNSLTTLFALSAYAAGVSESEIILPSQSALEHTSLSDGSGGQFYGTGTDMYIKSGTYGQKVNGAWYGAIQGAVGTTAYIGDYENIGDTSNQFLAN